MATNFWSLVDTEKYSGVSTAAMTVASLFGSTYLCESVFFYMNFIKNKRRTRLTSAHLQDSLRVAVASYTPDYNKLVNSMQCQFSHSQSKIPDVVSGKVESKFGKIVFNSKVFRTFMKCDRFIEKYINSFFLTIT